VTCEENHGLPTISSNPFRCVTVNVLDKIPAWLCAFCNPVQNPGQNYVQIALFDNRHSFLGKSLKMRRGTEVWYQSNDRKLLKQAFPRQLEKTGVIMEGKGLRVAMFFAANENDSPDFCIQRTTILSVRRQGKALREVDLQALYLRRDLLLDFVEFYACLDDMKMEATFLWAAGHKLHVFLGWLSPQKKGPSLRRIHSRVMGC
jgi:hypothetical protein